MGKFLNESLEKFLNELLKDFLQERTDKFSKSSWRVPLDQIIVKEIPKVFFREIMRRMVQGIPAERIFPGGFVEEFHKEMLRGMPERILAGNSGK